LRCTAFLATVRCVRWFGDFCFIEDEAYLKNLSCKQAFVWSQSQSCNFWSALCSLPIAEHRLSRATFWYWVAPASIWNAFWWLLAWANVKASSANWCAFRRRSWARLKSVLRRTTLFFCIEPHQTSAIHRLHVTNSWHFCEKQEDLNTCEPSSIVFRFLGESFSLQHPEDFLFLPGGSSFLSAWSQRSVDSWVDRSWWASLWFPPRSFEGKDWQIPIWSGYCTLVVKEQFATILFFQICRKIARVLQISRDQEDSCCGLHVTCEGFSLSSLESGWNSWTYSRHHLKAKTRVPCGSTLKRSGKTVLAMVSKSFRFGVSIPIP